MLSSLPIELAGGRLRKPHACAVQSARCSAQRVVIFGGTGRVGGSTAAALAASGLPLTLVLAGRDEQRARALCASATQPALRDATFVRCDLADDATLAATLRGADLVIHAAGPFQRQRRCAVLEAAVAARVPYLDVCDDTEAAEQAKALHSRAQAAGIRAVVCGGVFPGVSNLLAAGLVQGEEAPPKRLAYSYFTAGSGGAGKTILATSLMLCGEDAVAYKDGAKVTVPPVSGRRVVDFGPVRPARRPF